MTVREYSGNASATTLNGGITDSATALTLADGTGYPTGSTGPFVITVDVGTTSEEKVLCASRSGNSVTVTTRGYDGTTASAHDNGASVAHTISAVDLREANDHVNDRSAPHVTSNSILLASALASTYPEGMSYEYVVTGDGWPLRGICTTVRIGEISCVQRLQSDNGNAVQVRHGTNGFLAGPWSAWTAL